ncbi:MAG: hypothetical protein JSR64_10670 [Nitrospira sp.]|nr:hypothetical protein [Nitrospira sp.]
MFYRLRSKLNKTIYDFRCKGVLDKPTLPPLKDDVVILSAVGNHDLIMYLVAVKSFFARFGRGRAVVLVPDNFDDANLKILVEQVNPLRVIRDGEVRVGRCPRGGTWERLVSIIDLLKEHYVIQLDADTVTVGDIGEVIQCVERNQSFTIGTWANQTIEPMENARQNARKSTSTHVQILAEQNFDRLSNFQTGSYVRGQSSFAGFAKGSFTHEALEEFSVEMSAVLGDRKWNEWGSESLASNYVVANSTNAQVLPFPKYRGYVPGESLEKGRSFIHFEGTNRFKGGAYVRKSLEAIHGL